MPNILLSTNGLSIFNKINFRVNYMEFLAPYSPLKMSREHHPDKFLIKINDEGMDNSHMDMNDPVIQKVRSKVTVEIYDVFFALYIF